MNSTFSFYYQNILFYTSIIPIIGILLLLFINSEQQKVLKIVALNFSSLPVLIFLFIWGGFKKSIGTFQFVSKILCIPVLNINITLGINGISLFFLLLTTLLIPICILISWNTISSNLKGYLISFLMIEFLSDLWAFLRVRKKMWLLPIIVILCLLGALVVMTQQSALATFIYTLF